MTNNRLKTLSSTSRGIKSSYNIAVTKMANGTGSRPKTTVNGGADIDIFEDEDDGDMPGPGAYYNPHTMTSFKTGKIPERLQFFGSTVDRFSAVAKKEQSLIGPGSYTVANLINYHKKPGNQVFSGFTSTEQRFQDPTQKHLTPGPGQYAPQASTL